MPEYSYQCDCGLAFDAVRTVESRNFALCPDCGEEATRQFIPTANLIVPAHFRIEANWCLPDANDTAGWEARQGSSTAHAPKRSSFREEFDRVYKGDL